MPPKKVAKKDPQSNRRLFSWELTTPKQVRVNSLAVPGGKKFGGNMMVPPPHQIKIGGEKVNTGRGEVMETDESTKPLNNEMVAGKKTRGRPKKVQASGILSDVLHTVGSIADVVGLGEDEKKTKKTTKKGGRVGINEHEAMGAGIFSDIGTGLDAVSSILGLGHPDPHEAEAAGKKRTKKGGTIMQPMMFNAYESPKVAKKVMDGGNKREPSEWIQFVKTLRSKLGGLEGGVSYTDAMKAGKKLYPMYTADKMKMKGAMKGAGVMDFINNWLSKNLPKLGKAIWNM